MPPLYLPAPSDASPIAHVERVTARPAKPTPSPVSASALLVDLIASDPRFKLYQTLGELRLIHDEPATVRRLAAVLADLVPDVLAGDARDTFTALSYRTQCRSVCWADVAWELSDAVPREAFDPSRDEARTAADDEAADGVLAHGCGLADELASEGRLSPRDPDVHTVGRAWAFAML